MISPAKRSDLDRFFFFPKCHCNRICSDEKKKKLFRKCPITQDEIQARPPGMIPNSVLHLKPSSFFPTKLINTTFLSSSEAPG